MNIVFMGSPDFALPSLEKLHRSPHQISAVVSNVDKRRGRGGKFSPTPVKARAAELGYLVIEVEKLDDPDFARSLEEQEADLFVVVAFRILPAPLLRIPALGSVNLHASLLPAYRGAAPIHHAIMNGEEKTGCTVFQLEEEIDTGKIIRQQSAEIGPDETTGDLYERLKVLGADLLLEAIDALATGSANPVKQDDSLATGAPKLYPDDGKIDFSKPCSEVHNKIRGLSPFPGAWAELDDLKFNIYRSSVGPGEHDLKPGELAMPEDQLLAGCAGGTLVLREVQMAGKRRMSGRDFMNGYSGTGFLH